jgi:nucleotide-binding universal stress UspA family protein
MNAPASSRPNPTLPAKVLIAVDPSAASQHAVAYARNLVSPGGDVRLVSIAENPRTLVPMGTLVSETLDAARDELSRDARRALATAREAFAGCDVRVDTEEMDLSQHGGDIVHALIEAAHAWQADMIVVGARQHHGLARWIEGAVSGPLARLSHCPILIVPAAYAIQADRLPERILFAVDGSRHADEALQYGTRFATDDTLLQAVYVVDRAVRLTDFVPIDVLEDAFIEEGERALAAAKSLLAAASSHTSTRLAETERTGDDIAHAIVREAGACQAELIVMGTHGRRGVARWMLGSVAERVARLTHVPLLLVHASEG